MLVRTATIVTAMALPIALPVATASAQFTPLGFGPGNGTYSHATSVSDDGRFVGGHTESGNGLTPLIWNETGYTLLAVPTGFDGAYINDISADGSQAVAISLGPNGFRGVHWNSAGVATVMPTPTGPGMMSSINTINADGSVMGGFTNQTFFPNLESDAWSYNNGTQTNHGDIPGGLRGASFTGVTNDGSTFVGYADDGQQRAIRYTSDGFDVLGTVAGGSGAGFAVNIGAYGGTIVGNLDVDGSTHASYWTPDGTAHLIDTPDAFDGGSASATSADGSIIIGSWYNGFADDLTSTAFIWTALDGARALADVLRDDYGYDLDGWTLNLATDITPDGRTIVGEGVNPQGYLEAFKFTVPAPSGVAVLGAGALLFTRRRRV